MARLIVNGTERNLEAAPDVPLLWVLRERLGLSGTKYGCGVAMCGACTVQIDGEPVRSCSVPLAAAVDKQITTIEGLPGGAANPLVRAWVAEQVAQCGYCQSGQIMQAAALLRKVPKPTREHIVAYMDGNICRCCTYNQIIAAIERASLEG